MTHPLALARFAGILVSCIVVAAGASILMAWAAPVLAVT